MNPGLCQYESYTVPFVAVAYELLFFGFGRRLAFVAPMGFAALLIPLGLVNGGETIGSALSEGRPIAGDGIAIPSSAYLLTQTRVVVTYLRLLLLPIHQNLDYDFHVSRSLLEPAVVAAILVLVTLIAGSVVVFIKARSGNRAAGILVFFGVAWFFITLSLESSVIPIRDVIFEHRVYLPSAGAAVAIGTVLLGTIERFSLDMAPSARATIALLLIGVPLGGATLARNEVWRNELSLWTDVVAKSPVKSRPHVNLGLAYQVWGRLEDAAREYAEAVRLDPRNGDAHVNLGAAYQWSGRLDDAAREYRVAMALNPRDAEAHVNLGTIYAANGRMEDAVREYGEAIRIDYRDPEAHLNLGVAYAAMTRLDEAAREFEVALSIQPEYPKTHNNLGLVYQSRGQMDEAIREFREAIRLSPRMAMPHYNLARLYRTMDRVIDAISEYREALRLDPGMADARSELETLYGSGAGRNSKP